jgi:nitrous oxidase accessory protein
MAFRFPCGWRHVVLFIVGFPSFAALNTASGDDLAAWRSSGKVGALQNEINKLKPGDTLRLAPGRLEGPIIIKTPGVTIDGAGKSEINGGGDGTVVVIEASDVTLRDFRVANTGVSPEQIDAGVSIRSTRGARLVNLDIEDSLFGVDIDYSRNIVVEGTRIESKPLDLGLRGDAVRIHSSKEVLIVNNHWTRSRDVVAWYSDGVTFENNLGENSRYSLHSMYSTRLNVTGNRFQGNSVGIFLMYGSGITLRNNVISHSVGATGVGIGLKETSGVFVENNTILYCASGILVDNTPWEPSTRVWFYRNLIAFGSTGVALSNDREGTEFRDNTFNGNLADVVSESSQESKSVWEGNAWDHYEGFDRNRDGIGDTAYVIRNYGDGFDELHSFAGFFYGSPVQLLIAAIQRLAPLTEPTVLMRDPRPRLFKTANSVTKAAL